MQLYIDSEGDMEDGIETMCDLAQLDGLSFITLAFSSDIMYSVFMENLNIEFNTRKNIPPNVGIKANVILPKE